MGKFSFQINVQFTAALYLEMFFGANRILITFLRCKTTHHTWWWCSCNCQLYHWPIFLLMVLLVVLHVLNVELCYTRTQQQWDYVTGVISARKCSSTFHPDCVW